MPKSSNMAHCVTIFRCSTRRIAAEYTSIKHLVRSNRWSVSDLPCSFKSVTIPQRDDPRLEKLAKRCESCRPMGMFRSSKDEFLLCYDGTIHAYLQRGIN